MDKQRYTPELLLDHAIGLTDRPTAARLDALLKEDEFADEQFRVIEKLLAEGASHEEILSLLSPPEVVDMRPQKTSSFRWMGWVAAAAAIAILIYIVQIAPTSKSASLMAMELSAEVYPVMNFRSAQSINEAYSLYEKGRFEQARTAFVNIDDPSIQDKFYTALSAFYAGSYSDAYAEFKALSALDSGFADPAKWYLGVAALQTDNCEEAIAAFTYLSAQQAGYRMQQSRDLLPLVNEQCNAQYQ